MEINEKQFSAICYLVLMNHHGEGMINAHPSYIEEKLSMLNAGWDAYGYLDRLNQNEVKKHLTKWGYELPEIIKKY